MPLNKRRYELTDPTAKLGRPKKQGFKTHGYMYRVAWQRRDRETGQKLRPKYKHFFTVTAAERFWRLFGPAPWRYFRSPMDPNDRWPCRSPRCQRGRVMVTAVSYSADGEERTETEKVEDCPDCFGGVSVREWIRLRREQLPEILWCRVERRPVGAWSEVDCVWVEEDSDQSGETSTPRVSAVARYQGLTDEEVIRRTKEGSDFPF